MFDATNFLNTTFEEALDDKRIPCPVGDWPVRITKIDTRTGQIGKGDRTGQDWAQLVLSCDIDGHPEIDELCGRSPVMVFHQVFLDLTPSGGLDMGKGRNIELGAVRTAVGQNNPGQPWQPAMLMGQRMLAKVRHVPSQKDPSTMVAEVTGVAKL